MRFIGSGVTYFASGWQYVIFWNGEILRRSWGEGLWERGKDFKIE